MIDSPSPSGRAVHVGLNAHLLSLTQTYRGAGINGYIHNLLLHLPAAAPDLRYTAFLSEPRFVPPLGLEVRPVRWSTSRPLVRILWEQLILPQALRTERADLVHGLAYATPLMAPCPAVVTVHDLSFFLHPETLPPLRRAYLRAATRNATRQAERVIAVSRQTGEDLVRVLGVPAEKVDVVHNGVGEAFCPAAHGEVAAFRQRRGLPQRFVLFLGTLEPRKNVATLLEAFARWRSQEHGDSSVQLVVAGGQGWFFQHIFARVEELGLSDAVVFPGFVPGEDLPWWYRAAECFVYPSLYEGFGLPVLEAMACGTPVITSSVSSMAEVAGDAALMVDPHDAAALAGAIGRVLGDPATHIEMRQAGLRRAAAFSWEQAAAQTAAVYRRALGRGGVAHG